MPGKHPEVLARHARVAGRETQTWSLFWYSSETLVEHLFPALDDADALAVARGLIKTWGIVGDLTLADEQGVVVATLMRETGFFDDVIEFPVVRAHAP